MNSIKNINDGNIADGVDRAVRRGRKDVNAKPNYLTDEALEELIAAVEAESMLSPPKDFRDDVLTQIRRKRKYKKNLQLFSYSMKVIAATAAALGIVLIVPGNISTEESRISGFVSEWQAGRTPGGSAQEEKEQGDKASEVQEKKQYARETGKAYGDSFIYKLNKQMDEYVSIVNGKLNQFVRMEVNFNEEEKE